MTDAFFGSAPSPFPTFVASTSGLDPRRAPAAEGLSPALRPAPSSQLARMRMPPSQPRRLVATPHSESHSVKNRASIVNSAHVQGKARSSRLDSRTSHGLATPNGKWLDALPSPTVTRSADVCHLESSNDPLPLSRPSKRARTAVKKIRLGTTKVEGSAGTDEEALDVELLGRSEPGTAEAVPDWLRPPSMANDVYRGG